MLAELAVRDGYTVTALDYFGDSDLRALCPSHSLLRDYADKAYSPRALVTASKSVAAAAVTYGASFENHPDLVEELSVGRVLLGNTPETLRRVRDPFELQRILGEGGFSFPETCLEIKSHESRVVRHLAQRWLWKPLRGGGGTHVRWLGDADMGEGIVQEYEGIVQEYIEGMVCSFSFVANGQEARVIGVTEQLIGLPEFGTGDFRWCGNLSPPRVPEAELDAIWQQADPIAAYLTAHFGLRGLNGVDFVWRDKRIWVLEINPRPSASTELFDGPLFDWHVRGCLGEPIRPSWSLRLTRSVGKVVVFAPYDLTVGDTQHWRSHELRDIPHNNEHIRQGHPICTALATAATPVDCLQQLRAQAELVRQWTE